MNVVYVTGNKNKAALFNKMLGIKLENAHVEVSEIQSLDAREVAEHKARMAFSILKQPVIVEDTTLSFTALGSLPGPFIRWFLEELNADGLCRLLDGKERGAVAGSTMAYFDGITLEIFQKDVSGTIANSPRGTGGWGWDSVFVPHWTDKTDAEMSEDEYELFYKQVKPFKELRLFLDNLEA